MNAFRVRRLAHEAISRNLRTPFIERIYLFFSEIMKAFMGIISKLPVLIGVFLILFGIVGLSAALSSVDDFIENHKNSDIDFSNIIFAHPTVSEVFSAN